jgi:hypothetical protein
VDVSGGGSRSAAFVMNVFTRLDTITKGRFFPKCFLITGASGGMIGAAYFRELYWQKETGHINTIQKRRYIENISRDLLNPIFTSLVTRDMIGPISTFKYNGEEYIKDRGYAFEQKLNTNTKELLNKKFIDYKNAEEKALIPSMIFNASITRDGRKMILATHPMRFMMQATKNESYLSNYDIDALDFQSYFKNLGADKISLLTVLRMNATFPFVLPNIEMPTEPDVDVMDAGFRDNYGHETTLRFIDKFQDWLQQNTSQVVIIEIRDRPMDDWSRPYELNSISGLVTKPMFLLQSNWFNLQDYYQKDEINYVLQAYGPHLSKIGFSYDVSQNSNPASLSFHLTAAEKKGIPLALNSAANQYTFSYLDSLSQK